MKMYSDYHVHTNYSDDSTYLMEDVIKDAIKMKMDEICFTDHVDYGIKKDWDETVERLVSNGFSSISVILPSSVMATTP